MNVNELKNDLETLRLNIEIWKTIIETQKHFNDLEMKIRNFAILLMSAFIGAIGVSFKSGFIIGLYKIQIPVAAVLALSAFGIWMLFWFVDVYWYHPLLKGAVRKGAEIETSLLSDFPNINLTETITRESPRSFLIWKDLHSTGKANLFYISVSVILLLCSVFLLLSEKVISS